jgi:hypothetical protein
MKFAKALVVETSRLSEHFHRVVLFVPELGDLKLPTAADAAIGIYFDGSDAPPARTYTVRDSDPANRQITVDFLLRGGGPEPTGRNERLRLTPSRLVTPARGTDRDPTPIRSYLLLTLQVFPPWRALSKACRPTLTR